MEHDVPGAQHLGVAAAGGDGGAAGAAAAGRPAHRRGLQGGTYSISSALNKNLPLHLKICEGQRIGSHGSGVHHYERQVQEHNLEYYQSHYLVCMRRTCSSAATALRRRGSRRPRRARGTLCAAAWRQYRSSPVRIHLMVWRNL